MLREEFPDVTISKIRFLESQGLVNPERSPSGYRKFFEADVERLRWVLRQQREHFLPLKVIRDRLAEGDLGDDLPASVTGAGTSQSNGKPAQASQTPAAVAAGVGARSAGPASGGSSGSVPASGGVDDDDQLTQADNDAMARILADASRRAASLNETGGERPPLRIVEDDEARSPSSSRPAPPTPVAASPAAEVRPVASASAPTSASPPAPVPVPVPASDRSAQRLAGATTSRTSGAEASAPGAPAPPARVPPTPERPEAAPKAPAADGRRAASAASPASHTIAPAVLATRAAPTPSVGASGGTSIVTGASLTIDELCAASGLSEIEVAGLQGFGLIEGVMVAGILTFNEDALTVASLAMSFRRFGIEPRHLRLFRNSVDRELGLIEQVIIPLLRQRNPESRQRAVEGADELAELGQTMRAALLRAALRQHLGG
jgi:DNA-binding transcriptional MerR regulator